MSNKIGRSGYGRNIRFKRYMRRTYKNKLCALALLICGICSIYISGDASALLFLSMIALPLFFSRENWIVE